MCFTCSAHLKACCSVCSLLFFSQASNGAEAEMINLSTKVPMKGESEPMSTVPMTEPEKPPLPGWSEKMSQGILSGLFFSVSSSQSKSKIKANVHSSSLSENTTRGWC